MPAEIEHFICRSDNFGVLLHDPATGATAAIDVPDAAPYLAALERRGWNLTDILVTHRHGDHIDGIPALRSSYPQAKLHLPAAEAEQITAKTGPATAVLREGDIVPVGSLSARVIETPGHTIGHIVYYVASEHLLFAGDTLFALGCGRVFETPMDVMWHSLTKLLHLPRETQLYCGHDYTLANGRFALGIEPDNQALQARMRDVQDISARGGYSLPTSLGLECATNPFLRAALPEMAQALGLTGTDPAAIFAHLRERKNKA